MMSTRSSAKQVVDEMDAIIRHPLPPKVVDDNEDNGNGDDEDGIDVEEEEEEEEEDDDKDSLEIVSPLPTDPFLHIGKLLKFCEPSSCSTSSGNHHHHHQQPHHPFAASSSSSSAASNSTAKVVSSTEESRDASRTKYAPAGGAVGGGENSARNDDGVERSNSHYDSAMEWWAMRLEEVKEAAESKLEEVKEAAVIFLEHANDQFQKFGDKIEKQKQVFTLANVEKPQSTRKSSKAAADTVAPSSGLTSSSTERRSSNSSSSSECESSCSYEEDDDDSFVMTSLAEMDDNSRAAGVYVALETMLVAILLFATTIHIVKRLGGVFAIESRRIPVIYDDLESADVCGDEDEPRLFSFISFAPNNNNKLPT